MGQRVADGLEVRSHRGANAAKRHATFGEDQNLVEAGKHQRGRLVDGADHGSLALLRDVVEERDDGGGGGGIQTGGWLVEDDHARAFD